MATCNPGTADWSCFGTADEIAALIPAVKARAEALAWGLMNSLTAGAINGCPVVVRPCSRRCNPGTFYVAPSTGGHTAPAPGVGTFNPSIDGSGQWVNSCGCRRAEDCSCTVIQEVILPGPVGGIHSVSLDGAVLDPAAYRVDNGTHLVRQDGGSWPACQDMNTPLGAEGSFSVTYWNGTAPDAVINSAVGSLATEFYRACTGNKGCRLPKGVTNVVRQGVSYEIQSGLFANGYTGIYEVDAVIRVYNPFGNASPSTVLSPDFRPARRVTGF